MWDPLRRKDVPATPEENVRQWFIGILRDGMHVPVHQMMSEVSFRYGGKPYRADILVYDREQKPLAVVECKRPDVPITEKVAMQALRYDIVLEVNYIFLTNGRQTNAFRRDGGRFSPMGSLPVYEDMTCRQ